MLDPSHCREEYWVQVLVFFHTYLFIFGCTGLSCSLQDIQFLLGSEGSLVVACELLVGLCVGASSLTQDQTWAPYIGSTESQPLHHSEVPGFCSFEGSLEERKHRVMNTKLGKKCKGIGRDPH